MAWSTCEWCGKKLNGTNQSNEHGRLLHPREYAIREAQATVLSRQRYYNEAQTRLGEWHIITAYLDNDMPALIHGILVRAARDRARHYQGDARSDEEFLEAEVNRCRNNLATAQAQLAALEAQPSTVVET